MVSATASLSFWIPSGRFADGLGDAALHDQVEQTDVAEMRDLPRLVGLDVSVDEVAHVGFVGLQVEVSPLALRTASRSSTALIGRSSLIAAGLLGGVAGFFQSSAMLA
jgi:hypothetical protein